MDFDDFFASEERELLRFCWGLTLDAHDARDVAQEAMTRAYANWVAISQGNPAGWVRTVALNIVRQRWRSKGRSGEALARIGSRSVVESNRSDDPSDQVSVAAEVAAALALLSARQREAIVLHHMADRSVAEVAEAMGTSEATVKTHLQRGRAVLEEILEHQGTVAALGVGIERGAANAAAVIEGALDV